MTDFYHHTWQALEGKLHDVQREKQKADLLQRFVGHRQDQIRHTTTDETNELHALTSKNVSQGGHHGSLMQGYSPAMRSSPCSSKPHIRSY